MKKILFAVVLAACCVARGDAVADCARIFEAEIRDGVIHGAVVVAGGLEGPDVVASWGWADAAHTVPMTPRTVIDMASVTKTAAGVTAYLVAHARGKIADFDVPFTNCLPAYSAPLARRVTLRDLANHVSGFGEADGRGRRVYFSEDPRTMMQNILSMPPKVPRPGHVFYSCRNYVLLGQAFEATTGCRAAEFCRKEIFLPAGMADTSLGAPLPSIGPDRLAQTFGTKKGGEISDFVARPLWAADIGTFNAGLFSTAEDMAKLMRMYLRGGVCDNGTRLFGADEMAQIAPSPTNRVEGARTFGWQYATENLPDALRGTSLFHSGWSGQTVLFDLKSRRFAVVITVRSGDYNRAKRERFAAIGALLRNARATGSAELGAIEIRSDYPGGNVKVEKIDEAAGIVTLAPDLRDTKTKWFHFDFTLTGAAGRKLHFQFPTNRFNYLATLGPAISRDGGATWRWLNPDGTRHEPGNAFDYTFGADENETRFAVSIPYTQKNWDAAAVRWLAKDGVKFDVLCKSQSGKRDTELLRIPCRKGSAKWIFAFTARHHACETTANAVMEGVIDEILSGSKEGEWIRDNADCVFVPFMDKDGVENGDQGKNRRPHDHNRDYTAEIYTSVRAFKKLLVKESAGKQIVFFDLHSPMIRPRGKTGSDDHAFTFATPDPRLADRVAMFRRLWAEEQKGKSLVYDGKYDVGGSKRQSARLDKARKTGLQNSRGWVDGLPNCWLSLCGEFGYSLCGGVFTQDGGRELGHGLLKALSRTCSQDGQ